MKKLSALADENRTMVFYESPYRLVKALAEMSLAFSPEREASVSREISKMFEETIRGTLSSLSAHFRENAPKGEIVIVIAGKR
jgi:16S rRNA (cytidine1402-2'-O)-methyltransferase